MKEDLIEDIRAELNGLINHVIQARDVKRLMDLVRKLYERTD